MNSSADLTVLRPPLRSCVCPCRLAGLLCLLALLVGVPCARGQSGSVDAVPEVDALSERWVPSLRSMGQNALTIAEAPLTMSRSEQLLALGASGVVLSAMSTLDQPVYRGLEGQTGSAKATTGLLATPGQWYDRVGPDRAALGTAGLLAVGGLALQRRSWTRTSVRVLEAVAYTKLVTGFAKGLASRTRPFVGGGPFSGEPGTFDGAHTHTSMPSGHTARAFSIASVLAHQADRWYVSVPAYGAAASVGMERIRSGDHWLTDVMVGGALGYAIGRVVTSSPSSPGEITYTPILSTDRVGLSVQF